MNLNAIAPYVRLAIRSYLCAPFKIGQRIIFDYEIIYVASGKFQLILENNTYICTKGDVILIRPGQPHTIQSIDNISVSQPHIHFDMSYDQYSERVYISYKDRDAFNNEETLWIRKDVFSGMDIGPVLHISNLEAFKSLLYEIIAAYHSKAELYPLLCREKMISMLRMVIQDNTVSYESERSETDIPAMIQQYIDYNFHNTITLETLEKQFHYSKFYISRLFTAHTGCTVIKYYSNKRLEYAKNMLKSGASVSEVTKELNFGSIYAFSRHFKNAEGCSPSQYRQKRT